MVLRKWNVVKVWGISVWYFGDVMFMRRFNIFDIRKKEKWNIYIWDINVLNVLVNFCSN